MRNVAIDNLCRKFAIDKNDCKVLQEDKKNYANIKLDSFNKILQNIIDLQSEEPILRLDYIEFPYFNYSNFHFNPGQAISVNYATFCGKANFNNALIDNDIDFSNTTFSADVSFQKTTFSGCADFRETTFSKEVNFSYATFKKDADFKKSKFKNIAHFNNIDTSKDFSFNQVSFFGEVDFSDAKFKEGCSFAYNTLFDKKAKFSRSKFEGSGAFFSQSIFNDFTYFDSCIFKHIASFDNVSFNQYVNFSNAEFFSFANFSYSKSSKVIDFSKIQVDMLNLRGTKFLDADYLDITAANHKIGDNKLKSKNLQNKDTARLIKAHFEKQNNIIEANKYYVLEQDLFLKELSKSSRWNNKGAIFSVWLHKVISNSGTSYLKVLFWIFIFSFLIHLFYDCAPYMSDNIKMQDQCLYKLFSWSTLDRMIELINPINMFKNSSVAYKDNVFVGTIIRVISLYLFWQFTTAFRQNTRRK